MTNSVTTAFTSVTNGNPILIKAGEQYTYSLTGSAVATLVIQKSTSGGAEWEAIKTVTADTGPTTLYNSSKDALYRWECTAYTSGTGTTNVKSATEELLGREPRVSASTNVYEYGDQVARQTVIECNAISVTITDDAGVAQYGGVKVYDFPEGMTLIKGAQVNGAITLGVTTGTYIDNWDGDVAIGTVTATTGATLTSTEADIMQSVAVSAGASDKIGVVSAASVATVLTESGARWMDGSSTAKDMYLNFVVDDDATHTSGTAVFTGTIVFNWEMLGDK